MLIVLAFALFVVRLLVFDCFVVYVVGGVATDVVVIVTVVVSVVVVWWCFH